MLPHILLENARARLEPLEDVHYLPLSEIAIKHPDLTKYSPAPFGTAEKMRMSFEKSYLLKKTFQKLTWAIYDKAASKYAGSSSFLNISLADKRLEIGSTWLAPDFHRNGLNKNCKLLLLSHAFTACKCLRVEFKTDGRNEQSQRAILSLGAKYEGALRSHTVMTDGHRRDTLYYSILADEWPSIKDNLLSKISP